jgi:hypothetical protein
MGSCLWAGTGRLWLNKDCATAEFGGIRTKPAAVQQRIEAPRRRRRQGATLLGNHLINNPAVIKRFFDVHLSVPKGKQ